MDMRYELSFIGAGNMAEAIARAALDQGVLTPSQIIATDPSEARRQAFAAMGIATTEDSAAAVRDSKQVMLAVKPQTLPAIAPLLAKQLTEDHVVVSIMAGISTQKLAAAINDDSALPRRLVRVMPNTPMMVGQGMSAIATGPNARPGDDDLAMKLFSAGGKAIRVEEAALDAVTAVSGSGPAYVFYLAEAMEQAAAELGLGEHARLLVGQTLLGAATLLTQSEHDAAELRRRVTSPGGTTEAAIKFMESQNMREIIVQALKAADARSRELGR